MFRAKAAGPFQVFTQGLSGAVQADGKRVCGNAEFLSDLALALPIQIDATDQVRVLGFQRGKEIAETAA